VKNARTTCFSCVFCEFFSLWSEQSLLSVGDRVAMQTKVTAGKTLKRAGATPLLTASSRPNQSGVAPARHAGSVTVFWPRAGFGECEL
jgi:hypothetical protein